MKARENLQVQKIRKNPAPLSVSCFSCLEQGEVSVIVTWSLYFNVHMGIEKEALVHMKKEIWNCTRCWISAQSWYPKELHP